MDGWADGRTDRRIDGSRLMKTEKGEKEVGEGNRKMVSFSSLTQSVTQSPVPSHLSERGPLSGDFGERFRHLRPAGFALKRLNYAVPLPLLIRVRGIRWRANSTRKLPPFSPLLSRFIQKGRRIADPFWIQPSNRPCTPATHSSYQTLAANWHLRSRVPPSECKKPRMSPES